MSKQGKLWLIGISWLAVLFRMQGLFANSFHADEALFATWARLIAVWRDPLLLGQPVDKPPLLFYLQALFYPLQGPVEWAARLPGFIASLLLVPLAALLAWRLYRQQTAALAAGLLLALSPFAIQFSATAFIDPLLSFLLLLSLYIMVKRPESRQTGTPWAAGLFFGLAVAAKHQAWLFLPLLLGAALLRNWRWRHYRSWLKGFLPPLLAFLLWQAARDGSLSLWSNQVANLGGLRPAFSWELMPRLEQWLRLWSQLPAWPWLFLLLLPAAWYGFNGRTAVPFDLLILLFLSGFFLLHWLLAIPAWDRYLLPLLPLLMILFAGGFSWLVQLIPAASISTAAPAALLVLLLLMLPPALKARTGAFPFGGQPGADQGAAEAADLMADAPYGTVLYDHWYSWQWRYQLFDKRVYISWFPHADGLVEDLQIFAADGSRRYLALPASDSGLPVARAVLAAGFHLQPVATGGAGGIDLFEIVSQGTTR